MLVSSSVWPSGAAFATAAVPILVEAPGRLMMTKRWLRLSLSRSTEHARDQVGAAAGRERHDDLDRAGRVVLRVRTAIDRAVSRGAAQDATSSQATCGVPPPSTVAIQGRSMFCPDTIDGGALAGACASRSFISAAKAAAPAPSASVCVSV